MSTYYIKTCDPSAPHRHPRNGSDCTADCFAPVEMEAITVLAPARLVVNPIRERKVPR